MENINLDQYEHRIGKSRYIEVKINCEYCGSEKWVRLIRLKAGQGRYCSIKCANLGQRRWGKENVLFYYDKLKKRWIARWKDKDTGETKVQHKSKFIYEKEFGEVPDGFDIHHIDGNSNNDDISNLELVDGHLHRQGIHGSNRKVIDRIVYKQCFSCKEFFPEKEFTASYCRKCSTIYMKKWRKGNG